jgi:uncharacterized membrane protein
LFGLFVILTFLAPVFMNWGWDGAGKGLYLVYSFFCHQLPERSIFLFGQRSMYSLSEIQSVWQNTDNPLVLRQFIGDSNLGWKVAWSDRMISMYTSILIFSILWWFNRDRIRPLAWWGLILLILPMAVDGTTHFVSDLWGIEQGFRQTNLWLAELTKYSLPVSFYEGNALGSFNSWMRWITGVLFGLGLVWFGFPYLDEAFSTIKSNRPRTELNTRI